MTSSANNVTFQPPTDSLSCVQIHPKNKPLSQDSSVSRQKYVNPDSLLPTSPPHTHAFPPAQS